VVSPAPPASTDESAPSFAGSRSGTGGDPAIDVRGVRKTYGRKVKALKGIDLRVERGSIFGLLGPNGAGKSTLVKIMMTVIRASEAEGTVLGRPVGAKETLRRVGYLPEHHRMPKYLTGRQAVDFYGALAGVDAATRRARIPGLLDEVGMTQAAGRRLGGYSKGMLQRIGIAQALVNEPDLVVLDEPTDGVDPIGRRDIRDLLLRLRDRGVTVFVNSHLLGELEMVCDRVAILVQGEVRSSGTIEELTAHSRRYEIEIGGPPPDWAAAVGATAAPAAAGLTVLRVPGAEAAAIQPVIDRLRSQHRVIHAVRPARENLEELFVRAVAEHEGDLATAETTR